MNYKKIYEDLIAYRKLNSPSGYTENHHILPMSMGGTDDPSNIVTLTGREHWIAHLLLYKIYRNSQMAHACHMMAMRCEERGIPFVRNSRMYEAIRIICAKHVSRFMKISQKGSGNSQYGTMWITNGVENKKIKKEIDIIPEGWYKGRRKVHTDEGKKHLSDFNTGKTAFKNTYWITNGEENRRISIDKNIPNNWYKGRTGVHTKESKNKIRQFNLKKRRSYRSGFLPRSNRNWRR